MHKRGDKQTYLSYLTLKKQRCAKRRVWNDQLIINDTGIVRKTICVILTIVEPVTIPLPFQVFFNWTTGCSREIGHLTVMFWWQWAYVALAGLKCRNCGILVKKMVNFELAKGMNWLNDAGIFADSSFYRFPILKISLFKDSPFPVSLSPVPSFKKAIMVTHALGILGQTVTAPGVAVHFLFGSFLSLSPKIPFWNFFCLLQTIAEVRKVSE